jgi:hypothetical protein
MPNLREEQINSFLQDGLLVVDHVLNKEELSAALDGLRSTLLEHGVDTHDLERTGHHLKSLSSTHGSGGVLDLFYESWKFRIAAHPKLLAITQQLWKYSFCHSNEQKEDLSPQDRHKWHPYGAFDCERGYMYIDRIGYRLPTKLAEDLGARTRSCATDGKRPKKKTAIQRSLTPHLDCCPETFLSTTEKVQKWRPIQCFVALTDALETQEGGFEAVLGFHREFEHWASHRTPPSNGTNGPSAESLCVGDYTHIRPKEDAAVFTRIRHIPVRAGSAVFWDNRLPHANSYRHLGTTPRAVVYCSFLPDVNINRTYVQKQLEDMKNGRSPADQWINNNNVNPKATQSDEQGKLLNVDMETLLSTPLARHLAGLDSWEGYRWRYDPLAIH